MKIKILSFLLFYSGVALAKPLTDSDFKKIFSDRNACFKVADLKTGKTVFEYNSKRCQERFSPCSTFKIAAALMAFEKNILKDENQTIKWDGVKHDRPELNQDQTPLTWMSNSVLWVTAWIIPQLGKEATENFLDMFSYGNKDFSGPRKEPWQTSSLKISANEQITFLSKFWKEEFPLRKKTTELTKKIIFISKLGQKTELYGKTGTGCLKGTTCTSHPDKMLGWFVGVLHNDENDYVFASNASDLKPQGTPSGPRMRQAAVKIFEQSGLIK